MDDNAIAHNRRANFASCDGLGAHYIFEPAHLSCSSAADGEYWSNLLDRAELMPAFSLSVSISHSLGGLRRTA